MQTFKVDPAALERLMEELEKEYEAEHSDPENLEKLDELCSKISDLIGKRNWHYFREYTDRLLRSPTKTWIGSLKKASRRVQISPKIDGPPYHISFRSARANQNITRI